jgi:hypothetical protein
MYCPVNIVPGQVLALPGELNLNCTDVPGQLVCSSAEVSLDEDPWPMDTLYFEMDVGVADTLRGLNGWAVPADGMLWPGMAVALPLRHCLPNATLECVTRAEANSVLPEGPYSTDAAGPDYYGLMEIRTLGDNYGWEWGGINTRAGCSIVPLQAPDSPSLWPTSSDAFSSELRPGTGCMGDLGGLPGIGCRGCTPVLGCSAGEPPMQPGIPPYPSYCPNASVVPGSHFAYKVRYNDTLDHLDQKFGFVEGTLCRFNAVKNCSCLSAEGAWLKIPVVAAGTRT